jgi:hypothetical protein
MLNKVSLLDLICHFTVFEKSKKEDPKTGLITVQTVKKITAYHQYYAVNKAVESTLLAASNGSRKGGVVWHTQGSGKSLSMVFFTGKLVRRLDNPSVRARMKVMVKRLLRQYGYPPDKQAIATETVLEQAKLFADEWVKKTKNWKTQPLEKSENFYSVDSPLGSSMESCETRSSIHCCLWAEVNCPAPQEPRMVSSTG